MYELWILLVLLVLVLWSLRTRPAIFDNPVINQVDNVYHATVAPHLVRSHGFIEQIVNQLAVTDCSAGDSDTLCYEVRDAQLHYLLAVSLRAGVLYFQVISPARLREANYRVLREYADQVLIHHPVRCTGAFGAVLAQGVEAVAVRLNIVCLKLYELDDCAMRIVK